MDLKHLAIKLRTVSSRGSRRTQGQEKIDPNCHDVAPQLLQASPRQHLVGCAVVMLHGPPIQDHVDGRIRTEVRYINIGFVFGSIWEKLEYMCFFCLGFVI